MIQREPTTKIEWLESCCPEGDDCCGCDWLRKDYIGLGGKRHKYFCKTYNLPVKKGKKVQMCIDIKNLEELKHIRKPS